MNIILKLVFRYMKLNLKRTSIAIISISLSVVLLLMASHTFVWGFSYMKEVEVQTQGSWQARYNGLSEEQVKRLEEQEEFKVCTPKEIAKGVWQVDVELKIVDDQIFQTTQEIGKKIGMSTLEESGQEEILPNGKNAEYDVSYHMALLDYYGVTYLNDSFSMMHILFGVLAIIMAISTILIYGIFSLSFMEKKKYIGLLLCVGASLEQRCLFVFGEGILVGFISIPIGIIIGGFGSIYLSRYVIEKLNETYQLMICIHPTLKVEIIILVVGLSLVTILIAILVPTIQAGKVNALSLIFNTGKQGETTKCNKYFSHCSLEFNMALRQLCCNKQKCLKILFFAAFSIIVAFNGYISIKEMQGEYLLKDNREIESLDAWLRIYSDDFKIEEKLKNSIEELTWSKEVSYLSVLDMGAFIVDEMYVAEDLKNFSLSWWQVENPVKFLDQEEEYYGFPFKIIGIDNESFENYLNQVGGVQEDDSGKYSVIIDDYIPVQNQREKYPVYREVLDISSGEDIEIQFGTYADYLLAYPNTIYSTKDESLQLYVCSVSSEHVSLPIVPGAYGLDRDDYTQRESYYIKIYMPYSVFQKFLQDENVKKTYGKLENYQHPILNDRNNNPILNYICIEREKNSSETVIASDIYTIMSELGLRTYNSNYEKNYINDSNSWEYGNIESLNRKNIEKNATEILKRLFISGAILLVLVFSLFSLSNYILVSIYVRKRELSVLKSIGMGYYNLKKMLLYENLLLIISATVIGVIVSSIIACSQFQEYKKGAATIELHFPYNIFVGIVMGILVLTCGTILIMIRKVNRVNILDALKNENE